MKINTEGMTSGKLHLPVAPILCIIVPADIIKRVIAIPGIKMQLAVSSMKLFIGSVSSPYATLAIRMPNTNEGILAGGAMLIQREIWKRTYVALVDIKYVLMHHWL
jgi:hypothetical protein